MASEATTTSPQSCIDNIDNYSLNYCNTILLLIDLQQSFTVGSWKKSVFHCLKDGVTVIDKCFERCSQLLGQIPTDQSLILSICPFYLEADRNLDPKISRFVNKTHRIFLKPGNCILHSFGFETYLNSLLLTHPQLDTILMGGCTLTSCIRVSSCALKRRFSDRLRVVVSLELSGARDANYLKRCPSCLSDYMEGNIFGCAPVENCADCAGVGSDGISPVDMAVRNMREAGCVVVPSVQFK